MRRLVGTFVTLGVIVLMPLPALVFWAAGWVRIARAGPPYHGGLFQNDTTRPEVWVLLAGVYLFWIVILLVGAVWVLDQAEYHYTPPKGTRRPSRKERRRLLEGLRLAEKEPGAGAPSGRPRTIGSDPASKETGARPAATKRRRPSRPPAGKER